MSSDVISYEWALKVFTHWRLLKSHILTFVSTAPDTTTFMLGFRSTMMADALVKCPVSLDAVLSYSMSQLTIGPP